MMTGKAIAALIIDQAIKYIRDDQLRSYSLLEFAYAEFEGENIGIGNFDNNEGFRIASERGGNRVRLESDPFDSSSHNWNGPDIIPDTTIELKASLWHDLISKNLKKISEQTGFTEKQIWRWANGIFVAQIRSLSNPSKWVIAKTWMMYNILNPVGTIYKKIKSVAKLSIIVVSLAIFCGCANPPKWKMSDCSVIMYERGANIERSK